ncbi:peptidoglycan-associated lipoprotein Pal [Variovorax sp. PCZ-1]|uniref:peptidoglycan-associated lipoprotein Pal n=1 Tax=Variovorax sp. PCZ-1 TaxID=2835533 RepID=UPI001BCC7D1E|nr:peptidoglycan-associated lipoprotein Pal [Variovorax sp. PCZ-1]MBS7807087.1 peptidoglycan-associated lipoprotein Pal [Variovorax sp. PCZ-1]
MIFQQRITSIFMTIGAAFALAACGSSVKLDDVPVRDATSTQISTPVAVTSTMPQGTQTGVAERNVQAVNVSPTAGDAAGPAGVAKVILFDYDSYVIKPEYQSAIDAHAKFLTANKGRKMAIEGHTDESGGREYNLALGQKRAEAVRRALGLLGVVDAQVEAVSFGEEKPADAASNEQAYAKNRRAELNYK